MKRKTIFCAIFLLLSFSCLYAQESVLSVLVVDGNNQPVEVAKITYKTQQRFSNTEGKNVIDIGKEPFDKNALKVEKKGYPYANISYNAQNKEIKVVLSSSQITSNEAVGTVKKQEQQKKDIPTDQEQEKQQSQAQDIVKGLSLQNENILLNEKITRNKVIAFVEPLKNNQIQDPDVLANLKLIRETLLMNQRTYEGVKERNQFLITELNTLTFQKDSLADVNSDTQQHLDSIANATEMLKREREIEKLENQQRSMVVIFIMIFLAIVIALLFLFGMREQNRKNILASKNEKIEAQSKRVQELYTTLQQTYEELKSTIELVNIQKEEISQKNEDITASIQAAKLIQDTILPSEQVMQSYFSDLFILYKPRDIVSGDFYYFSENLGRITLAAVDCTGHGVPGAFMSMMGNQILNEIIEQKHIYQADKILHELNLTLYHSLRQRKANASTQSVAQAGMEIALCVIDKKNHLLEYAGAMNPLYYVQGGQFHEIKSDKHSIGGADESLDKIFSPHYISLHEGTTFYICSDGYQDQFGGNSGKKFMVKRLKSLLFSIHDLPMSEQKKILERELDDWQGKEEQVDDILLIGFKV